MPDLIAQALMVTELGSAALKVAQDEISVHRQAQKRAADLRHAVLTSLLDAGVIDPTQTKIAEAMLSSHAETLGLLKTAGEKLAAALGQNVKLATERGSVVGEEKTAASEYDSLNDHFLGRTGPAIGAKRSDNALRAIRNK